MIVIGIDPASDGSACIMRDNVALVSIAWSRKNRKRKGVAYRTHLVDISIFGNDTVKSMQCANGADIGTQIGAYLTMFKQSDDEPFYVACEDAYVGKNSNTAIFVARFAGMVVGALYNYARGQTPITWIKPQQWQTSILKVRANAKREQRKEKSLAYIPTMVQSAKDHLDKIGQLDHITDAIGIALYAIRYEIPNNTNS